MVRPISSVSEHMTASVVSVLETTSLEGVMRILREKDISCVLVTTVEGAPAGVVSLTDLARVSRLEGGHHQGPLKILPPDRCAKDIMKAKLVTVDVDADVSLAARTMLELQRAAQSGTSRADNDRVEFAYGQSHKCAFSQLLVQKILRKKQGKTTGVNSHQVHRNILSAHMPQATSQTMVPTCSTRRTPVGLT